MTGRTGGRRWNNKSKEILERDGHQCRIRLPGVCRGHATQTHHVIPIARGGDEYPDDSLLIAACSPCNNAVGDRLPNELGSFRPDGHPCPPRTFPSLQRSKTTRIDHE